MSSLRSGVKPVVSFGALAALTVLAGCASTSQSTAYPQATYVPAGAPPRVAQAAVVEDDGLPAQAPPPARIRQMPDNPVEPFSRNYGGDNPARLGVGAGQAASPASAPRDGAPAAPAPADRAPPVRQKLASTMPREG